MADKNTRICKNGHQYLKSSDCPTCPTCENKRKPKDGFLSIISAPARRALENAGIHTLHELANYSESQLLKLHGVEKTTIPKLRMALEENHLTFRTDS